MVRFEICGNLGRDPKAYNAGTAQVVRFTVAHTFPAFTTDRGQMVPETTTWLNISAWGQLGKAVLEHLHKGDKCFVSGIIRQRESTDQQGNKQYYTDYEAREVEFMTKRSDQQQMQQQTQPQAAQQTQQQAAPSAAPAQPTQQQASVTTSDYPFPPADDIFANL